MDTHLPEVLQVGGKRCCIFGDSGYDRRRFMEIGLQGSNVSAQQFAFKKATPSDCINVDWVLQEVELHFTKMD